MADTVKYFPHTGYCPKLGKNRTIRIGYMEIPFKGTIGYKREELVCPDGPECPHVSKEWPYFCSFYEAVPPDMPQYLSMKSSGI